MCLIFLSSAFLSSTVFTLSLSQTLLNRLDHLIAHASSLGEARSKVRLYLLKLAAVAVHVAKGDAFGPVLFGGKGKLAKKRNTEREGLTLAANVNSRSSRRKVLSSMAVSMTSSSSSGLRKRYSVMPSQRRKSCLSLNQLLYREKVGIENALTGVEQII